MLKLYIVILSCLALAYGLPVETHCPKVAVVEQCIAALPDALIHMKRDEDGKLFLAHPEYCCPALKALKCLEAGSAKDPDCKEQMPFIKKETEQSIQKILVEVGHCKLDKCA